MSHERITLEMSLQDMVLALAEGNIGAVNVMMTLIENESKVDPDSALSPIGSILGLDTHAIYGSDIWVFFKDVSGQNIIRMIGLLRAVQLGYLPVEELKKAIQDGQVGRSKLDPTPYLEQVRARLPRFGVLETELVPA